MAAALCLSAIPAEAQTTIPRLGGLIAGKPAWSDWKTRFVAADGRVVDTGNQDISHSEGQGYGLLLSVAADDREAFDRIWTWTRVRLGQTGYGLVSWRAADRNNATDGDLLIAWALAEGADLWRDADLRAQGAELARTIFRTLVRERPGYGPILMPGAYGFGENDRPDGPVVNLSYWVFPAFARMAQLAPEFNWAALERSGYRLLESAIAAQNGPPADWLSLADSTPRPARRFPARYGYDALRIPLYLALAGRLDTDMIHVFPMDPRGVPIVSLTTRRTEEVAHGDGFAAISGLVRCAVNGATYPKELLADRGDGAYYPATLRLLAQIVALTAPEQCAEPKMLAALRADGWRRIAPSLPAAAQAARADLFKLDRAAIEQIVAPADHSKPGLAVPLTALVLPAGLCLALLARRRSQRSAITQLDFQLPEQRTELVATRPTPARVVERPRPQASQQGSAESALLAHADIAGRSSAEWRQKIGLIVYAHSGCGRACGGDVDRAVACLRKVLNSSNFVGVIGPREIGVCLSLLNDRADLARAAGQLDDALREDFGGAIPFASVQRLVGDAGSVVGPALSAMRRESLAAAPETAALPARKSRGRAAGKPKQPRAPRKPTAAKRGGAGKPTVGKPKNDQADS